MRGDIAELCLTNYGARGAIAKKVKTDLAVDLERSSEDRGGMSSTKEGRGNLMKADDLHAHLNETVA
jgi:hypothetical protein